MSNVFDVPSHVAILARDFARMSDNPEDPVSLCLTFDTKPRNERVRLGGGFPLGEVIRTERLRNGRFDVVLEFDRTAVKRWLRKYDREIAKRNK